MGTGIIPSPVWALSSVPSNPFRSFFTRLSPGTYTCANQSSSIRGLSLPAALRSPLVLQTRAASSPHTLSCVSSTGSVSSDSSLRSALETLSVLWTGVLQSGSSHLFLVSQRSLLFVACFCIFCLGFLLLLLSFIIALFWSEGKLSPYHSFLARNKSPFVSFFTSIFQTGYGLFHRLTLVTWSLYDLSSKNQLRDHPLPEASPETFSLPLYASHRIEPSYSWGMHSEDFMISHVAVHQCHIPFLSSSCCFWKRTMAS